jgi:hypothetical protein
MAQKTVLQAASPEVVFDALPCVTAVWIVTTENDVIHVMKDRLGDLYVDSCHLRVMCRVESLSPAKVDHLLEAHLADSETSLVLGQPRECVVCGPGWHYQVF